MIENPFDKKNSFTSDYKDQKNIEDNERDIINDVIEEIVKNNIDILKIKEIKSFENKINEILTNKYNILNNFLLVEKIKNKILGYDILEKHIKNIDISDIRITNYKTIFIKEKGSWILTKDSFENKEEFRNFITYCILKNGGKINNEFPISVVSDSKRNLRIEAGINPVNVIDPNLIIRIHRNNNTKLEELFLKADMIDFKLYKLICLFVFSRCNIIISGKGGSGKTSLLRAIINKLPKEVAITSNEETAEILSNHPNIIQREVVSDRLESRITLDMLTRQTLVMSNDCIVIGEMKGSEAMCFSDAISTGHIGYATIHAESGYSTIDRLIMLMKKDIQAIQYTDTYLKQVISNALDVIIYMENYSISQIIEVGFDKKDKVIIYNCIYDKRKNRINKIKFRILKRVLKQKIDTDIFWKGLM